MSGSVRVPPLEEVELEAQTVCNARCSYCAYPSLMKEVGDKRMEWPLFEKVVRELEFAAGSLKRVHLHHVNEPLLDKHLERRITHILDLYPGIEVGFSTNGILLRRERTDALLSAGLNLMYVTIPSSDPEQYKKAMGVGANPRKVMEQFEYFLEQAKGLVRVVLRSPVGFDTPLRELAARHPWVTVEEMQLMERLGDTEMSSASGTGSYEPQACGLPWVERTLIVAYNGDVPLCCNDQRHRFIIGSVADRSVEELWTSRRYAEVRSWMQGSDRPDGFPCDSCEFGRREVCS